MDIANWKVTRKLMERKKKAERRKTDRAVYPLPQLY